MSFTPSHNSLFLPLIRKDFNHESGFLNALTTARSLLLPSNLSSGCSSKLRSALVHIVTAVHSTSGAPTRPQDVDWALVHDESATMAPLPCETSSSREDCWARRASCHGLLRSRCGELPTASLTEVSTGVLWVLTGDHPCGTSNQARWWRYQSASSYVRGYVWW